MQELKRKLGMLTGETQPQNKKDRLIRETGKAYSNYLSTYSLKMNDDEISKARKFYQEKLKTLKALNRD